MFDMTTGEARHIPRHPAVPLLVSTAAQIAVIGCLVVVPLLFVTDLMPEIPAMMAFVASPPPPPPPPPPAPAMTAAPQQPARPVTETRPAAAPIEAPSHSEPEPVATAGEGVKGGVEGGVPGGLPGGVLDGVLGGIPSEVSPPPPPPPQARAPVRIGGQIQPPALLYRVQPEYPDFAVQAKIEGMAILEAEVDEIGRVVDVRVLRSAGVLDRFAVAAVKQWRYSPLLLNGRPERFLLTVTLSFSLKNSTQ